MGQLTSAIEALDLSDEMTLSIGDSLYGTEACRQQATTQDQLVHIFRLNSKRNIFFTPKVTSATGGRRQEFGAKMNLGQPNTQPQSDQCSTTSWTSRRGKPYTVTLHAWHNMLLRGSRTFRSSQHPMTVIRIEVTDETGKPLYKRPLWLAVFGKRRHEINAIEAYEHYRTRYDIEHFFRFSKRNLLLDGYQTPDVLHEEQWWSLCLLAYLQLYLAKGIVSALPKPWERYLPEYKNSDTRADHVSTPSQTQRGFSQVLEKIGSPAKACIKRGNPRGRMTGAIQPRRETQPIIFKTKKSENPLAKKLILGSDTRTNLSDPQKIETLIELVQLSLGKLEISAAQFTKMLIDSS